MIKTQPVETDVRAQSMIPLCVPVIRGNEWQYVKQCLDTGWVSSVGSFVDAFERTVADRVGAKYGIATMNGTSALHTALLVAGIRPADEVLVSSMTFIAPANAIRYVGAVPVFIDSEPNFWQMDPKKVGAFLEEGCIWKAGELINRTTGRPVRAILPVHILGHPVEMQPIRELARKYSLTIIEDATESLGATYRETSVGMLGDIACFSFNGNKLITTGGGGMIVTNRSDWANRARALTTQSKSDPLEYIHDEVGYNYRLTNLQAALGMAQMEQLDEYIAAKRAIAARYDHLLRDTPGLRAMPQAPWAKSVFWMYTVMIETDQFGMDSRTLLQELCRRGIQARPLWQPIHRSPAHQGSQFIGSGVVDTLYQKCLSIPCSVNLSTEEQDRVIENIRHLARRT